MAATCARQAATESRREAGAAGGAGTRGMASGPGGGADGCRGEGCERNEGRAAARGRVVGGEGGAQGGEVESALGAAEVRGRRGRGHRACRCGWRWIRGWDGGRCGGRSGGRGDWRRDPLLAQGRHRRRRPRAHRPRRPPRRRLQLRVDGECRRRGCRRRPDVAPLRARDGHLDVARRAVRGGLGLVLRRRRRDLVRVDVHGVAAGVRRERVRRRRGRGFLGRCRRAARRRRGRVFDHDRFDVRGRSVVGGRGGSRARHVGRRGRLLRRDAGGTDAGLASRGRVGGQDECGLLEPGLPEFRLELGAFFVV